MIEMTWPTLVVCGILAVLSFVVSLMAIGIDPFLIVLGVVVLVIIGIIAVLLNCTGDAE